MRCCRTCRALDRPDDEERCLRFNGIDVVDLYGFARWAKLHYWANYNRAATITLETGPLSPQAARSFALMRRDDDMRCKGIRNRKFSCSSRIRGPRQQRGSPYPADSGTTRVSSLGRRGLRRV